MRLQLLVVIGAAMAGLGPAQTAHPPQSTRAQPTRLLAAAEPPSFLGVGVREIDSDRAKALKLPEEAGVEVMLVDPNSPAFTAGLKAGDVVLKYNGETVEGIQQFSRLVRETPAGREVKLEIFRNGALQTLTAKIGSRPAPPGWPPGAFTGNLPDIPRTFLSWRSSVLGVEAESLEGQLADYFGVKEGVLVRSVVKGSAADQAGIKAGDVIIKVSDGKVATVGDVSSRIRSLRGKSVPMVIIRERKEKTLKVALPNDDRSEWLRHRLGLPL
jgi:serine protease Do